MESGVNQKNKRLIWFDREVTSYRERKKNYDMCVSITFDVWK